MEENTSLPHIVIDSDATPEVAARLLSIDQAIHNRPENFRKELARLGSAVVGTAVNKVPVSRTSPRSLLKEYFAYRYDSQGYFDDETELAIKGNAAHQELVSRLTGIKSEIVSVGKMKKATTFDHDKAEAARNAVRHSRLSIYVARVALSSEASVQGIASETDVTAS